MLNMGDNYVDKHRQLLSSLNINVVDGELFICRETNIVPF